MKKTFLLITIILVGFLFGCNLSTTDSSTTTTTSITTASSTETTLTNTTQTTTQTTTEPITTTEVTTNSLEDIYLYSVNDFHGGAYFNFESFSKISNEIKYMKSNYDNVIALTNGDIFQGTAISNYYYGRPLVEAMNEVMFDGFIIGNHEFDWGIDKIAEYNDGSLENGEANFPFLAANIVYKDSLEPLEFTQPYIIKETSGIKIGIIGVIGDVINAISASRVENIQFLDPVLVIEEYAYYLRTEADVDIVVVYIHSGSYINEDIANLSGDYRVDVVFNAHTHQSEIGQITREGMPLIYAQASANANSLFVRIKLTYDKVNKTILNLEGKTYSDSDLYNYDPEVDEIFNYYKNNQEYLNFVNQVLTNAVSNYYRYDLAPWGASVIRDYLGIDIGAVNAGGFRTAMYQGEVTMGDMVVIYPFDNIIKTSKMTGQQILDFYEDLNGDVIFDDGLTYDGYTLYINDSPIVLDQYYTVGAVDYIFDKPEYDFLEGEDITYTGYFMRDLLVQDLLNSNNSFNPSEGTSYTIPLNYFLKEIHKSII